MTDMIKGPFVFGDVLKMSGNPETAEALRQRRVSDYHGKCPFRRVTSSLYDHQSENPIFVECEHPEFSRQNYAECLGQCAVAGQKYGR